MNYNLNSVRAIFAALLVFGYSGHLFAAGLLSEQEQQTLDSINSQYQSRFAATKIDEKTNTLNTLNSDVESAKIKLVNNFDIVKTDTQQFQDKLQEGDFDQQLVDHLKDISQDISALKKNISDSLMQIDQLETQIEQSKSEIVQLDRAKSASLVSLYETIKKRYIDDAKHVYKEQYDGRLECDVTESISVCVNRNLPSMKNAFMLGKGGLDRVKITSFKVEDATQKMNGDLNYSVGVQYQLVYSSNIEMELRKTLGLDQIRFVFRSNSDKAVFYIGDERVGSGSLVNVSGDYVGSYNVKVVNGSKTQSLKLTLENDGDYYFPFSNVKSAAASKSNNQKSNNQKSNNQTAKKKTESKAKPQQAKVKTASKPVASTPKPQVVEKKKPAAVVQNVKDITNQVLYKDPSFTFVVPQVSSNQGKIPAELSLTSAKRYCEQKLSSRLLSKAGYQYISLYVDIQPGSYWMSDGKVYSAQNHDEVAQSNDTNKFICMVSMTN